VPPGVRLLRVVIPGNGRGEISTTIYKSNCPKKLTDILNEFDALRR